MGGGREGGRGGAERGGGGGGGGGEEKKEEGKKEKRRRGGRKRRRRWRRKRRRGSSSTGGAVRKLCKHKVGQHNLARVYSAILNIHTCALSKSFYGTFMQASVRDCSEQQSSTEPTTITGMYFGMSLIEHNGIIIVSLMA